MNDAKEAMRVAKMLERLGNNVKKLANNPYAKTAAKTAIGVGDLFAPIPGGKVRTGMRVANATEVISKHAFKKIMAKRAAKNEAEKAILAAGGLGAATALTSKKNKKK